MPHVLSPKSTYPSGCGLAAVLLLDVTSVQSFTLPTQGWTEVGVQQIDPAKALVPRHSNQTRHSPEQLRGELSNTDSTRDYSNPSTYSPNTTGALARTEQE